VTETQRTGELPAPQGGAVQDGTYALTARNVYPPAQADAAEHSATLRLSGGAYELVRSGGSREAGTVSTMTIVMKLSATCPTVATQSKPYTATATTLSLMTVSESIEEVFTKQQ